ncbi:MAG: hypothetical protein MJZ81_07705 [Bacteroidales bacterium]|nr:hypothetical protein [Bacteroidales bacterium]
MDAVNDSNGSTSSDGNTVKRIFCTNSNDSNISYFCHLKLVGDVQLTEEVRVYDSLFIDLNGHTISITNDGSIKFDNYENRMFVLYGKKNNSSVNCILTGTSKCAFACPRFTYVIGGNYTFSAAPDDYRRHSLFEIYDGGSRTDYKKSDFNVLSYFKDINVVARNSKTDSMRIIHDSRFELSSTLYIKGCVFDWLTKNAKYNSGHVVYSQAMNTIIE